MQAHTPPFLAALAVAVSADVGTGCELTGHPAGRPEPRRAGPSQRGVAQVALGAGPRLWMIIVKLFQLKQKYHSDT